MNVTVLMNQAYIDEMNLISKTINSYPGYKNIAAALGKIIPQPIVAGLVGCIVPESGTNHRILNSKEYNGKGARGTSGWNCGEGLIQWTKWEYKLPLIKQYNADPRSTQKLPEDWETYSKGTPIKEGNLLLAKEDGMHIAGLSLENQMLFLSIYYQKLINSLTSENNLANITAKIYQTKAGTSYYKDISDPIERAYTTSKTYYPSTAGNHYLQSVKIAQEYCGSPISPTTFDEAVQSDYFYTPSKFTDYSYEKYVNSNNVPYLSSATKRKESVLQQTEVRKNEFDALRTSMVNKAPQLGRNILLSEELYDSNILKGSQESKKDRT